jgi:hypothetical protein
MGYIIKQTVLFPFETSIPTLIILLLLVLASILAYYPRMFIVLILI